MDACGKFGEHERSVRVAQGDSPEQLWLLEWRQHGDNNLGAKTCVTSD